MTHPRPAAVLWDMDGTIFDTEPYWIAAEGPLVERYGGHWNHEKALGLVGLGLDDAARILQNEGVDLTIEEIQNTLTDQVIASVSRELPYRPGARELLAAVREAGVPSALVTMSLRRMATAFADAIDFDAFDVVVAGDDATRPKPHPDPYLQAATALGVDINDCVVIEDSPTGTRAGVASGAAVLAVTNLLSLEGLGAHRISPSLTEVTLDDLAALVAETHAARVAEAKEHNA